VPVPVPGDLVMLLVGELALVAGTLASARPAAETRAAP
jgi:hypothetical protein